MELFQQVVQPLEVYNQTARSEELGKYTIDYLRKLSSEESDDVLVAVLDGSLCGFSFTKDDDHLLWLSWYGVLPRCRGHGVAKALLEGMKERARRRGYWKVWCDSRSDNVASIRCMQDVGFDVICEIKEHWYGQDFVLLQCYLDETKPSA